MKKVVVYAATRNLYQYLPMAIWSTLKHNPDAEIVVIAEDDYIDIINHEKVKVLNFNTICSQYLDKNGPNYHSHWTAMSLSRLCLPKILNESICLWLDVDTLVLDNLDELFQTNMEGKYVGSVMEPELKDIENPKPYVNSGVTLMNLELMRQNHIDDKMLYLINTYEYDFPDQDVLNQVSRGHIKYLHPKWNISPSTTNIFKPSIIHFTLFKLWNNIYVKLWREYYKEHL